MTQLGFDTTGASIPPSFGFTTFDGGKYPVLIKACAPERSQANPANGMLIFELEFLDGKYKGQTYNHRCNLWHSNPETVRIAQQEVTAIAHVCGIPGAQDSEHFVGRTMVIEMTRDDTKQYKNNVSGVFDMAGNPPGRPGGTAVQVAAAPAAVPAAAPAPAAPAAAPAAGAPPAWGAPPVAAAPAAAAPAPIPAAAPAPAAGAPPWG